jgi:hypothetical protein
VNGAFCDIEKHAVMVRGAPRAADAATAMPTARSSAGMARRITLNLRVRGGRVTVHIGQIGQEPLAPAVDELTALAHDVPEFPGIGVQ